MTVPLTDQDEGYCPPTDQDEGEYHPTDQDEGLPFYTDQGDGIYHAPARVTPKPAPPAGPEPQVLVPDENGVCSVTLKMRRAGDIHAAALANAPDFRTYEVHGVINAEHVAKALFELKWYGAQNPGIIINTDDVPAALQTWGHYGEHESKLSRAIRVCQRIQWAIRPPLQTRKLSDTWTDMTFLGCHVIASKDVPKGQIALCDRCWMQ